MADMRRAQQTWFPEVNMARHLALFNVHLCLHSVLHHTRLCSPLVITKSKNPLEVSQTVLCHCDGNSGTVTFNVHEEEND